jgi:hypothetical protein
VLVVVASPRDRAAEALAKHWGGRDAALLTPADLSRPGWKFDPAAPRRGIAVIGGRRVPVRAIRGVLTRLPAVFTADLPHIVEQDRNYVAAEMTAFLLAWLTSLRCAVVNRPVAPSLAGPCWHPVQWAHAAHRAGLRTTIQGRGDRVDPGEVHTDIVLAGRCLGAVKPRVAERITRLAAIARVDLLAVHLRGDGAEPTFVGADPWPDPSGSDVAAALLEHFERSDPC